MTLYLIGLGLGDEKDISVRGLEIVKKCDTLYLENYTSLLQCSVEDLEKLYGTKITLANRETTEQGDEVIVEQARKSDVGFLVVGDSLSATTHVQLVTLAREKKVDVQVVHNASILTAVGITGLELYKFGKVTSIPFVEDHPHLETPYRVFVENQKIGLHTLFLLDLKPSESRFMTVGQGLEILEKIEERVGGSALAGKKVIGCARLGSSDFKIVYGSVEDVKKVDFGREPHCIIIPGKMHFVEEEMLESYSLKSPK